MQRNGLTSHLIHPGQELRVSGSAGSTSAQPAAQGEGDAFREKLVGYGITPGDAPEVLWNFEKFLIAKDGSVAARFAPTTNPDDPALVAAIEAELAK